MGQETTNFGGIPTRARARVEHARIEILPVPFEGTVSYGTGTARGPQAILDASCQVETHDDETGIHLEDQSYALAPAIDVRNASAEEVSKRVRAACRRSASTGRLPLVLGGEHSVTVGAVRGVRDACGEVEVLSIDAHPDLRDSYEGDAYSHACVGRRVLADGPLTIVGARSWSAEEAEFMATSPAGLRLFPARDVVTERFDARALASSLAQQVYVTFDVDGLDPAVIPATGTPEPGGLSWWGALALLRAVFAARTVVGMDVVELAPPLGERVSSFAAARLVAKMISYWAASAAQRENPS